MGTNWPINAEDKETIIGHDTYYYSVFALFQTSFYPFVISVSVSTYFLPPMLSFLVHSSTITTCPSLLLLWLLWSIEVIVSKCASVIEMPARINVWVEQKCWPTTCPRSRFHKTFCQNEPICSHRVVMKKELVLPQGQTLNAKQRPHSSVIKRLTLVIITSGLFI